MSTCQDRGHDRSLNCTLPLCKDGQNTTLTVRLIICAVNCVLKVAVRNDHPTCYDAAKPNSGLQEARHGVTAHLLLSRLRARLILRFRFLARLLLDTLSYSFLDRLPQNDFDLPVDATQFILGPSFQLGPEVRVDPH